MSAIAIPLPSRQASRGRTDEPVAGSASDRGARQSSRRPRLRLVTDDFVPEVPVRRSLEGARCPVPASAGVATLPAVSEMRRPAAPVALRGRRTDLERLAPQHPAVRAAGLRRSAQQEEDRRGDAQSVGKSESVLSRPRKTVKAAVRSRAGLRLLRGGLAVIVAAFVLACGGLVVGALAGLVSAAPATAVAQVSADTTTTTVVRPGQSLWDIAEASGTSDVPGMVARIAELNDLQGTTIRAGQTLEIPTA